MANNPYPLDLRPLVRLWRLRNRIRSHDWGLASRRRVECNCCGWQGRKFLDFPCGYGRVYKDAECPRCISQPRHRGYYLYLKRLLAGRPGRLRLLHFAPEPSMESLFRSFPNVDYLSVDIEPGAAMRQEDITRLSFADGSFDMVFCIHVLEHIEDERSAMSELARVLSDDGFAILDVPMNESLAETYEDPSIVTPEARARAYWQFDHVRLYGRDYSDRLAKAGFSVRVDRLSDMLDAAAMARHGLPTDPIHYCQRAPAATAR